MPFANPLTGITEVLRGHFRAATDLVALAALHKMQFFDKEIDVRSQNPENETDAGLRLWLQPTRSLIVPHYSTGDAQFQRVYELGIGSGSLDLDVIEQIEWEVSIVLVHLRRMQNPDGTDANWDVSPLEIESILAGSIDPQREPILDPEEFQTIYEITVNAFGAVETIAPHVES